MKSNILLSKIVPNATEYAWSQAYSTLNLFIVISLEKRDIGQETEPIASFGKEILERLQREFFSLEEKKLSAIKTAVEKTADTIDENIEYSIVLATLINNALYVLTTGKGMAVIKRGGDMGIVAKGEERKTMSFSGFVESEDIIILQTNGFSKKIHPEMLSHLLDNLSPFEITENIAPIIHGSSKGTEAAIVIRYTKSGVNEKKEADEETDEEEKEEIIQTHRKKINIPSINFSKVKNSFFLALKNYFSSQKKIFILATIVSLTLILAIGIFMEKSKGEKEKISVLSENVLSSAQKKYEDAQALIGVNKIEAIKNLQDAEKILNEKIASFKEGSEERKKIENMLKLITEKKKEIEEGETIEDEKIVFNVKNSNTIQTLGNITLKGGSLIAADEKTGGIILLEKDSGKVAKEIKSSLKALLYLTANAADIYLVSQGAIYSIDKNSKKEKKIIDLSTSSISGIETFLGNIYLLDKSGKIIDKYTSPTYKKASYLQEGAILTDIPISFSIDGSIWIFSENGKISKFTKGKQDDFSVKGLISPISNSSQLYTDADFKNIYILDRQSKKIFVISKNGDFQKSYNLKNLEGISSFAVDESGKKIYISSSSKIYSFQL